MCGGNDMKLIGVTAYGISVRSEKHHDLELHNLNGTPLLDYFHSIAESAVDEYDKDLALENIFAYNFVDFQTIKNVTGQKIYDILYLRIKTGDYGEESEIVDSDTGETTHTKSVDEADVMPFGCCLIVPCGKHTEGIVLAQSLGRNGITSIIKKKFNEYIRQLDNQLRVVLNPIVPRQYMERLLSEGVLKTIRLISYGIPDDDADRYGVDRGASKVIRERVIRKPTGFIRNKYEQIMECFRGQRAYDSIIELDDFEIDDLKMEFSLGKRNKTISMRGLDDLVINEDITDDVIVENGHPKFDSLCKVMTEIGEEYLRARGAID